MLQVRWPTIDADDARGAMELSGLKLGDCYQIVGLIATPVEENYSTGLRKPPGPCPFAIAVNLQKMSDGQETRTTVPEAVIEIISRLQGLVGLNGEDSVKAVGAIYPVLEQLVQDEKEAPTTAE